MFRDEKDLEKKLGLLRNIAGPIGTFSRIPFPPCPDSLTESEAQLISEVARNGLASDASLGKSLKISARTS